MSRTVGLVFEKKAEKPDTKKAEKPAEKKSK